ncbi:MAG: putative metal-binding motif-containing protein [Deltaproteobacteria bacterium]|nr:putative metal-binding motif-containing protein [Deltaproteobacteria bacterium]
MRTILAATVLLLSAAAWPLVGCGSEGDSGDAGETADEPGEGDVVEEEDGRADDVVRDDAGDADDGADADDAADDDAAADGDDAADADDDAADADEDAGEAVDGDEADGAEDVLEADGSVECTTDGECDDGFACTADSCDPVDFVCLHVGDDAACSDGDACTGVEVCTPGVGCEAGTAVVCDDGVSCTTDTCDPADGSCGHAAVDMVCDDGIDCTVDACDLVLGCDNVPDDGACDDLDACNGAETCIVRVGCAPGLPVECDDGIGCTVDSCNSSDGLCSNTPDDTACPPSAFCAGAAYCDPVAGCAATAPPSCDDAVPCTVDTCDLATGDCVHTASDAACGDGTFCNGDESCDLVLGCLPGVRTCGDSVPCTVDTCDEAGDACVWTPDNSLCIDADLCDGAEICNGVLGCRPGVPVSCDDGFACTADACTPATGACTHVTSDPPCNDGLYCNGVESCAVASGCVAGTAVSCDDSIACTVDTCDESADTCQHVANHALCGAGMACIPSRGGCVPGTLCSLPSECSDGVFCNGAEDCVSSLCVGGTAPDCNDSNACTIDSCSETAGACVHVPQDRDADTYGDAACGGTDCNDLDLNIHPGVTDPCDGVDNDCDGLTDGGLLPSGSVCTSSAQCCTGSCIAGICNTGYGLCESPGTPCATPAECCSGRCEAVPGGGLECVGTGACEGTGGSCLFSADCCSFWCAAGTCDTGFTCRVTGSSCTSPYQCCSGLCSGGTCASIGGTCSPLGETCTSSNGCCSGWCDIANCGIGFFCRASGELCNVNADCCDGICEGYTPTTPGRCAFLGGCLTVGQPCTGNRNCCSKACVDPGTGVRVCTYLSGCRPYGELCTVDANCCSGLCEPDDAGRSMRCQNPPGCQPAGEMCFTGATNNCCGGHDNCRPTIAGVNRCWPDGWTVCLPEGDICHFGDECCSGVCSLQPDGTYRCGGACIALGGTCTADADCCTPNICRGGTCQPPDAACSPLGTPCLLSTECCSGFCFDGFCAIDPGG